MNVETKSASQVCSYEFCDGGSCSRQSSPEEEYCQWHARREKKQITSSPNPSNGPLEGAYLKDAVIESVDFDGVELSRSDLSGASIADVSFNNTTLNGTTLASASLSQVDFVNCSLDNVDARQSTFDNVSFQAGSLNGADLEGSELLMIEFDQCSLDNAKLVGITSREFDLRKTSLTEAQLSGEFHRPNFLSVDADGAMISNVAMYEGTIRQGSFDRAAFTDSAFHSLRLVDTSLDSASLSNVEFPEAQIYFSTFERASVQDAKFTHTRFEESELRDGRFDDIDFSESSFEKVNFSDAELVDSDLSDIDASENDLRRIDLSRSDLTNANLVSADLSGADLSWCDLSGANLESADLSGVNLRGADLTSSRLHRAILDDLHLTTSTQLSQVEYYDTSDEPPSVTEQIAVLRGLARAARESNLHRLARQLRLRQKRAERREAFARMLSGTNSISAARDYYSLVAADLVTGHGEAPSRVVLSSLMIVSLYGMLYWLVSPTLDLITSLAVSLETFVPGTGVPLAMNDSVGRLLIATESSLGVVFLVILSYTLVNSWFRD